MSVSDRFEHVKAEGIRLFPPRILSPIAPCHCEERSDAAIQHLRCFSGLLRCARNDGPWRKGINIRTERGFTLVEMMVALLIFSLLSVAGVALLRSAIDSDEITGEKLGNMAEMQRFVSLIEADLSQVVPRSYRDTNGNRVAAFSSDQSGQDWAFLTFTSGGQSNINDKPRSSLQRIEYHLSQGRIERFHFEMTDGGEISAPARLLENIENMDIRYRNKRGVWLDAWQTERLTDLPRAVEIRFLQNGRSYRHMFLVGTGYL
ncbi:hypothetical protein MNBD_ALPHA04-194 [hydrothermal vent metagenome]|uniref:Type II secretion system protein J n=1 Tax=hydrothermal vent metagenome TaxID=652676 RepID=A0A3B0RZB0_9ZZZZ